MIFLPPTVRWRFRSARRLNIAMELLLAGATTVKARLARAMTEVLILVRDALFRFPLFENNVRVPPTVLLQGG